MNKIIKPHEYSKLLREMYVTSVLYRGTAQLRERLNTTLSTELAKLGIKIDE